MTSKSSLVESENADDFSTNILPVQIRFLYFIQQLTNTLITSIGSLRIKSYFRGNEVVEIVIEMTCNEIKLPRSDCRVTIQFVERRNC